MMVAMMVGEAALEVDMSPVIEGLVMITLVVMNVKWVVGLVMLKMDLMVGLGLAIMEAQIGIQGVVVMVILQMWGILRERG